MTTRAAIRYLSTAVWGRRRDDHAPAPHRRRIGDRRPVDTAPHSAFLAQALAGAEGRASPAGAGYAAARSSSRPGAIIAVSF